MSLVSGTIEVQRELYSAEKGLIVHSSSFEKNGQGFICGGVCGIGKSTLCFKLQHIFTPINDDRNLLEFTDEGLIIKSFWDQNQQQFSTKKYLVNQDVTAKLRAFLFVAKESEKATYLEKLSDKALIWKRLLFCAAPPAEGENQLFGPISMAVFTPASNAWKPLFRRSSSMYLFPSTFINIAIIASADIQLAYRPLMGRKTSDD